MEANTKVPLNEAVEPAVGLAHMNKQQLEELRADLKLDIQGFAAMNVNARRAALVDTFEGMQMKLLFTSLDKIPEVYMLDNEVPGDPPVEEATTKADALAEAPVETPTPGDTVSPDEIDMGVASESPAPDDAAASPAPVATSAEPSGNVATYESNKPDRVKFIATKRNLSIQIGRREKVVFDEYIAYVDDATARLLRSHILFHNGHVMEAAHAIQTPDGKLIKVNDERIAVWMKEGKRVFMFPGNRRAVVKFRGYNVNFDEHFAALSDPERIANMRGHMFFVQGRIIEVAAA